jgi:hypothetical protein
MREFGILTLFLESLKHAMAYGVLVFLKFLYNPF